MGVTGAQRSTARRFACAGAARAKFHFVADRRGIWYFPPSACNRARRDRGRRRRGLGADVRSGEG